MVNYLRRSQRGLGRDGKADWCRQVNGIERWSCLHQDLIAVKEPDGVLDPHDIEGGFQRRRPAKLDLGGVTTHQSPSCCRSRCLHMAGQRCVLSGRQGSMSTAR